MNALTINNLKKTYKNGVVALKGANLTVKKGDFFALLGPNGAGKSTVIGIVASLVTKTAGKVEVFGQDMDSCAAATRMDIGLVPQEFNFNIFEPIEEILINQAGYYGINRHRAKQRAEKDLKQLDLWDKRRNMAKELSGGMKRRLMIARALMHQPQLLILDEPTAGVDIEIRHSMWAFLKKVNQEGTTIILTTHYLEEAESLCNTIAIIDHGLTIEQTSMRNLLDRLHQETFVLYLKNEVTSLPECEDFAVRCVDKTTLEVDVQSEQLLSDVFTMLEKCGVQVYSMKNKTNRLEQLFMSMVKNREGFNAHTLPPGI
ncbi:MAG TPA: ABC transporter ATP-binding protein, partial [Thiotrichales bacterium]|nr:ABC transporter ATP-binding protein [Thiotrichales bacterium]